MAVVRLGAEGTSTGLLTLKAECEGEGFGLHYSYENI